MKFDGSNDGDILGLLRDELRSEKGASDRFMNGNAPYYAMDLAVLTMRQKAILMERNVQNDRRTLVR